MRKARKGNGNPSAELLAFTIDASTGKIIKLEGLTADGVRHELTADERARLIRQPRDKTVERVVERAFEAGIACVLDGDGAAEEDVGDSTEDVELAHRLLSPLIAHSAARELLARDVVARTVLDTLIEHSLMTSPVAGAESAVDLR